MSEVKVNKISPRTNCGTVQLGDSGDTITIPSGATITNNGTQTGFGRTGTVDWQTGSIKTATFTAANGEGYFANTSGGAFTMNLPAGTAGNIVSVVDYTNTFQTNNLTITPNGSQKIGGVNASAELNTEGQSVTFVYVDDTEGWKNVQDSTSNVTAETFMSATGGTTTTCGNFKIHKFTGPGTFTVCSVGVGNPLSATVDYLVVAGGGSGGADAGAGGGAGGFRAAATTFSIGCAPAKPLVCGVAGLPVSAQGYPITVGAGATAPGPGNGSPGGAPHGVNGSNSIFSSITSAGGGGGGGGIDNAPPAGGGVGADGGSGGGGRGNCGTTGGGSGNTPPVSPAQGTNGGTGGGESAGASGGGGGAIVAGAAGGPSGPKVGGAGGAGAGFQNNVWSPGTGVCSSCVQYFAGGGSGGGLCTPAIGASLGGGGASGSPAGGAGTTNSGGGGGGGVGNDVGGGTGGSGIVVIRYRFQ
jgi:hypothetical protein